MANQQNVSLNILNMISKTVLQFRLHLKQNTLELPVPFSGISGNFEQKNNLQTV